MRVVAIETTGADLCAQRSRDRVPPHVVTGRYRHQRTRVVVEGREVGVAGGLDHAIEVAGDTVRTVVKPPGRAELSAGQCPAMGESSRAQALS